jgi:hypothetical protein
MKRVTMSIFLDLSKVFDIISHENLIKRPAHPDFMSQTCGKCHNQHVAETSHSLHFTLKNTKFQKPQTGRPGTATTGELIFKWIFGKL